MIDLRGKPLMVCVCGSLMWEVKVMWDQEDRTIGWYDLTQTCVECGAIATAPTEIDKDEEDGTF